jgi:hypothetical protein
MHIRQPDRQRDRQKDRQTHIRAVSNTHGYLMDLGARIAADKSYTFSTHDAFRDYLRHRLWTLLNNKIPNILHCRDLGAHLNVSNALRGGTLTQRIHTANNITKRLLRLPIPKDDKVLYVISKLLPLALYACEATHVNESALRTWGDIADRGADQGGARSSANASGPLLSPSSA